MKLVTSTLLNTEDFMNRGHNIVPLPWNDKLYDQSKPLTFGYFDNLEAFPATPGVRRAVHVAKAALEKRGHKVIPFNFIDSKSMLRDYYNLLTSEGGKGMDLILEGEIVDESVTTALTSKPFKTDSKILAPTTNGI